MTTILLIEDATDLALVIQRELELRNYRVLYAPDGLVALDLLSREEPGLIILDWMLPKMDGLEVLRKIRQKMVTPVLMLTARGEETDRVVGLELGADDYLTKPFGMQELLARVHALLRRMEYVQTIVASDQEKTKTVLRSGALMLDPETFRATLDDVPLELTCIEFNLLCLMLRNPGRVFNRNYLLETVWNAGYLSGDRSVDNTILRLRKKLGTYGEYIETVWGVGYRLNIQ